MRMHEFVSRSLKRRLTGKQRGEYEKQKHLIREHGGPSLRPGDRGHTEAVLAHHGISSIPKVDRNIGFRGPASIKKKKAVPSPVGRETWSQGAGFGVTRSGANVSFYRNPSKATAAKPKYETILNPERRRAHQIRGGPTPKWGMVKHHLPPHREGAEPGGESMGLRGREKLNRGLGPAAHPRSATERGTGDMRRDRRGEPGGGAETDRRWGYVHPAKVHRIGGGPAGYPPGESSMPNTGGEQHTYYPGDGHIQPLSRGGDRRRKDEGWNSPPGGGGQNVPLHGPKSGAGRGTVPREKIVGIGHRAAESLRAERSSHGNKLHKEGLQHHKDQMGEYEKDLKRYEDRKTTQSGKRGSGRGPGTGKPSTATRRIWSSQYKKWIDAPVSRREESPVRHRKEWWEDDYSYPLLGSTLGGGASVVGGFGSPKKPEKPEKPKPLSTDMIGTKKGLRKKYKEWKKTGETAFHHPDGTPKSSFQPSDELIRYHTARERGLVSNIHEYGILKNQGKAPRLPHEGGKHPADFNEFSAFRPLAHKRRQAMQARKKAGEKDRILSSLSKLPTPKKDAANKQRLHDEGYRHAPSGGPVLRKKITGDFQEFATAIRNPRTNMAVAKQIMGGAHEDPRKLAALKREAANRNIGEGRTTGPLEHPEESRLRAAQKAYTAMARKGRMGRLLEEHTRSQNIKRSPLVGQGRRDWDRSDENLHEFYGPAISLRDFRPGHLEFRGRKTGGRGKKMMMPGHYKFAQRGGPQSMRDN